MKDSFLIVDGNSLMHRAFHALPLMDADGVYTNAIFGFLNMLIKAVREENAKYLAICFDEHGPTFRHEKFAEYKAGRAQTPPELRQQFDTVKQLLDDMGIRRYGLQGWEADDLLGTLSLMGQKAGLAPLLLTGDRDALQLVCDNTTLIFTRKGISETVHFTPDRVQEEYGFSPEQVIDWKGLAGDSSDNIPGVPGIGDKTAVKLLQEYGNLETVLEHAGEIKGKLGEKLAAWADQARMCRELATIHRDAPVEFTPEMCEVPDINRGIPALKKLKLYSIIRRLEGQDVNSGNTGSSGKAGHSEAEGGSEPWGEASGGAGREKCVMLSFGEPETLDTPEKLKSWLEESGELPLCIAAGETEMSLARENGKRAAVQIGGDLLLPGLAPDEALEIILPYILKGGCVVHDGKALLHLLDRYGLSLPESFGWDTMLGAYLLNPQEKSYTLSALSPDGSAGADALCSLASWQRKEVERENMTALMTEIEMPLSFALFRMERAGFTVDRGFLENLGESYRAEIQQRREEVIEAAGGTPFNLNSPQQLGEVLFEKMRLPHGKKTSRGYSTSAEILEGLRFDAPQVIEPLLRYRQLSKLNGTYVEGLIPLIDRAGRVHSKFDQVGTATGRLSSLEPNLQNIPVRTEEGKEIRRAFLPEPGWILLDADYSQIELRLMAHFSGDRTLIDAFRNGEDIHARTASEIFDVPLEWVTPELRSRAKAVNFGLIYGISGFGLSRNTGVSRKEAAEFIEKYFQKYPGVKGFMDASALEGAKKGYAETLMGRRRYLPELQSDKATIREFGKRAAMNTPIQGTAADIIKMAMIRVDRALREKGLRSRMILQVHDELLMECPPEEQEQAAQLLREAMEQVIELKVPLVAEVHTGMNWAEAK